MPLNPALIGKPERVRTVTWTERDTLLYALAVGAGQCDPLAELALTTENTAGVRHQAVPTLAVVLGFGSGMPDVGEFDPTRAVHAEQVLELDGPLPVAGEATVRTVVTDMWDKGTDAMIWTETTLSDSRSGRRLALSRTAAYLGGAGGFGGVRGASEPWHVPDAPPDQEIAFRTRPEQALLYRLTGDRNPLHSDPAFAARGGFARPILHGMCTYGYATRLLLSAAANADMARLQRISGRFTQPVLPGDELNLMVWGVGLELVFRVVAADGTPVIDRGRATLRPPAERN